MEGELGTSARIAIGLIVLGFVVSVVFTVVGFVRGTTNQGLTSVQNSIGQLSQSQFDNYDQQIISGNQVMSAVQLFQGEPVALVVRTTGQMASSANTGINYGALLSDTNMTTYVSAALTKATGSSYYVDNLYVFGGTPSFNMNTVPMKNIGTVTYVRPTAKFLAELIKDSTGTTVGVVFTQE